MATNTEVEGKVQVNTDLKEPSFYKFIYMNDDVTTYEFVVGSLVQHFEYSFEQADQLTKDIHENGSATVAVLPFEIAEQKALEVIAEARESGYPLDIRLKKED
jgi:ATP-dependent Clp protease adaptor protein ClpS